MAQWIWGDTPMPMPELDFVTEDESWTKLLPPGSTIVYNKGHGSSIWSQAAKITVRLRGGTHESYFIKLSETYIGKHMAQGEYLSMVKLHQYGPDITPRPIGWGTFVSEPDLAFCMFEFVDMIDECCPAPKDICPQLAAMHIRSRDDPENPGKFGWDHVTCAGPIVQANTWNRSWETFFTDKINSVFTLEEKIHGPCEEYNTLKPALLQKVIPRLLRPLETGGNKLTPVFIHGDLYHLNAVTQAKPECPVMIFDVASFWAHHEYEFFQWNSPRYLFDSKYTEEYRRHNPPSAPTEDADDRLALYSIVADLDSSLLYPSSTRYRQFALEGLRKLVAKFPDGYTGDCNRLDEGSPEDVHVDAHDSVASSPKEADARPSADTYDAKSYMRGFLALVDGKQGTADANGRSA